MQETSIIERKLEQIVEYLDELVPLAEKNSLEELLADSYKYHTAERLFQLIVDTMTDVNIHLIKEGNFHVPDDFQSSFYTLAEHQILPSKFAQKIAPVVGVRNRLVHRYESLGRRQFIEELKKEYQDFQRYLALIRAYVAAGEKQGDTSNAGFGLIGIIITLAIIALIGGGGLYLKEQQSQKNDVQIGAQAEQQAKALKQKIESQDKKALEAASSSTVSAKTPPLTASSTTDTSNWKTYRNENYWFEVRYPPSWRMEALVTRAYYTEPDEYIFYGEANQIILEIVLSYPGPRDSAYKYNSYEIITGVQAGVEELKDSIRFTFLFDEKNPPPKHWSYGSNITGYFTNFTEKQLILKAISTFKFTK